MCGPHTMPEHPLFHPPTPTLAHTQTHMLTRTHQHRGIQGDHMGVLALPVAEFLAVKHNTAYLGYSQHSSSSAQHPFFASGPPRTGQRPTDADAADADAEAAAAAAMDTDGTAAAGGAAGGSPSGRSPRKSGGAGAGAHHHKGGTLRRPSSEVGLRLITCSPESTLGAVSSVLYILMSTCCAGRLVKHMGVSGS